MNNDYDISRSFQRIEERLIKSMKANLTRHLNEENDLDMNWSAWQTEQLKSLEYFKKQNSKLFKNDFSTINDEIEDFIKQNYENGKVNQERIILEAIRDGNFKSNDKKINKLWHIYNSNKKSRVKKKQLSRIFKETENGESSFFKINDRKLKVLINETTSSMKKAEKSVLRYTNDQYRKIIFDAQVYANTGSGTVKQAIDMATQDFLSKGINNIEYANGRMVNIASYAEMAIRTANLRAYLQGEGTKRQEWGVHTVLIPNRGGGCPYCIKYQGKVFIDDVYSGGTKEESVSTGYPLLSTAMKGKLFHPNCKDTAVTYFPGINSEAVPPTKEQLETKKQNYIKEQKLRYIDRNIDKYKRLEMGSVDPENVEKYHNKKLEWQEYKEKFKMNSNLSFKDINNNTELDIPKIIDKAIKDNNQTINKKAEEFINNNLTENDVIQEKLDRGPFTYRKNDDKIVIDPNHEDIQYYDIDESIVHEIIHMKDIREKITDNNFMTLDEIVERAKVYIHNNYNYFYNYVQRYPENMAFGDIMSALSNGSLPVGIGHPQSYWKNDTIVINELAANLLSSEIVGNQAVDELLEEIPPLKKLREECMKLWHI